MKKRNLILAIVIISCLIAFLTYNYIFNSKHRDISSETATVILSADALYEAFKNDEAKGTTNFLDKVIELKGKITSVEDSGLVLDHKVEIDFNQTKISHLKEGQITTVKGRCVGYDDLLEVVKIDQATLLNKN